ncbi:MAG: SOS response-associated peptidase [Sphingobacteriaceae bacterium]|nr:MAG: SOS response-associated peptidase [Sphingobacteriaceae bacterium]
MCARFTIAQQEKALLTEFEAKTIDENYRQSYNLAPTQLAPVIIAQKPEAIQLLHFGLVPFWSKDKKSSYSMMNARQETVLENKTFKPLMIHNKRCLVLADGFYEWKTEGKKKLPYRFKLLDREAFAFAGLWSQWKSEDKKEIYESFTILTTTPNAHVGTLHNRMPVILAKEEEKLWLSDDVSPKDLISLCDPYPDEEMDSYAVSTEVNKATNNHQDLILPTNSQ